MTNKIYSNSVKWGYNSILNDSIDGVIDITELAKRVESLEKHQKWLWEMVELMDKTKCSYQEAKAAVEVTDNLNINW